MDRYGVLDEEPVFDDEPVVEAAPTPAPETQQPVEVATPPSPPPLAAAENVGILEDEPEFEEGSMLPEIAKGVAAGAVNVIGQAARGTAPGRVDYMDKRRQELARRKAIEDAGYSGNNIDASPEDQAKISKIAADATAAAPRGNILEDPAYQWGKSVQDWSDEQFKAAQDYENTWTRTISEGLGSTIPFMAASVVPGVGTAIGAIGGMQSSAGEALDRAIKGGATREQLMEAVKLGSLPGLSDQASVEALFAKVPLPAMGKFASIISKVLAKAAVEGGQEGAQQAAQNIIEKYTYDPKQDIMEGVVANAAAGAVVGGVIAAPIELTTSEPEAKVEGQSTPGGTGTVPAQPAAAPTAGRVVKQVEEIPAGGVPADIQAAAPGRTPEQALPPEAPQTVVPEPVMPVTPEQPAVAEAPAAPVATGVLEEEPEFDEEATPAEPVVVGPDQVGEEEDVGGFDDDDPFFDEDEELLERDIAAAQSPTQVRESAADRTKVAPADEDLAAAMSAQRAPADAQEQSAAPKIPVQEAPQAAQVSQPEPMPTEGARYLQPDATQPLNPEVPEAGPSSAATEPVATAAVPEIPQVSPAAPVTQEPVQTPEGVAAFSVQPTPQIAPAASLAPDTTPQTPISRSLGETIRTELFNDPVSEQEGFQDAVDVVAREMTLGVGRGVAPAKFIRDNIGQAVQQVKDRFAQIESIKQRGAAQQEEQDLARAQRVEAERTVPRERSKPKTVEAVKKESRFSQLRRLKKEAAKPAEEQDEDLKAVAEIRARKAKIKGPGKANAERRQVADMEIAARMENYAKRKHPEAAPKPAPTPKPELAPEQVETIQEATDEARAAAAAQRSVDRNAAVKPAVEAAAKAHGAMNERQAISAAKGKEYIRSFVSAVQKAAKDAGHSLGSTINTVTQSPQENLAIYMSQIAAGKRPGTTMTDAFTAQFLVNNGDTEIFNQLVGDQRYDKNKVAAKDIGAHRTSETGRAKPRSGSFDYDAMENTGTPAMSVPLLLSDGNTHDIPALTSMTSTQAIEQAQTWYNKNKGKGEGVFNVFRRMHLKMLKQMIGETEVFTMNGNIVNQLAGKDVLGFATYKGAAAQARGEKQLIVINNDHLQNLSPWQRHHLMVHEMTHVATVWAIENNFRNTGTIAKKLYSNLKESLQFTGEFAGLDAETRYAFHNEKEFIAEGFANQDFQQFLRDTPVPLDLAEELRGLNGSRRPTWWNAFVSMVQNAMGMSAMKGRGAMNYFDAVVALHPDIMVSAEEQMIRSKVAVAEGKVGSLPMHPMDVNAMLQVPRDRLDAGVKSRVNEATSVNWLRRQGARFATTEELKRRSEELFGGVKNPFTRLADAFLSKRARRQQIREAGDLITSELYSYSKNNPEASEKLSDVLHEATVAQVDPSQPLASPANGHISKKGNRDRHRRKAHAELSALYNKLPADAKALYSKLATHYQNLENTRIDLLVKNIIDAAIEKNGVKLPAGVSRDDAVTWVTTGSIDRIEEEQTQHDKDMHKALGSTAKSLKGTKEMRRVKGVYVPLTRWGKYFFTAKEPIPVPDGARVDPESDGNVFIFDDLKKSQAYTGTTKDQIQSVISRWFDPVTGERSVKQEPNSVNRIYVTVQNKIMEMHDSPSKLAAKRRQYAAQGYETSEPDLIENNSHSSSNLLPAHLQRLMRSVEQSTTSDVNKNSARAAIVNAYIKQLAGSRAQHRQLKRQGVKGFSRDLVHATYTNNNIMAGHITNLEIAPQAADAEEDLKQFMDQMRYAGGNADGQDTLRRRALYEELKKRIDFAATQTDDFSGQRFANGVMEISFLSHLFSPAYTITNLTQPFMTTMPVLSGHYGWGKTMKAITRAYYDMGALKTLGRGVVETAKDVGQTFKTMPRMDPTSYHNRIVDLINKSTTIKNKAEKLAAAEKLRSLGFGTDSGIEVHEISEISKNWAEIRLHRITRIARALPEAAEAVNRYVTMFAAIDLAVEHGANLEQAVDYASTTVEQTQGGYSPENNPAFMRHWLLRIPLQFKKYALMYGQLFYGNVAKMVNVNSDRETRVEAAKQVAYLSASMAFMAGTAGLPLMEIAKLGVMFANLLGITDDDWDDDENAIQEWYKNMLDAVHQGDEYWDTKGAEILSRGVFRAIGIDMSSRLGADSLLTFGQPRKMDEAGTKSWLFDMMVGAPGGVISDIGKGIANQDWAKAVPYPKFMKDAIAAYDQHENPRTTPAGKQYADRLGWYDTMLKGGLGLNPATIAQRYEAGGSGTKKKADVKQGTQRQKTMGKWLNATPAERTKIWRDVIIPYNKGKPQKDKIEYGDLTRTLKRRKTDAAKEKAAR